MGELIRTTPDRERARSLLSMVSTRLMTINLLKRESPSSFSSKIVEEYYESVLELITALMSAEGYKTRSDIPGSHIASIGYLREMHGFPEKDVTLIDTLRKKRSGVKYYGAKVSPVFVKESERDIIEIINKLKKMVYASIG